jgi:hypothetical protein
MFSGNNLIQNLNPFKPGPQLSVGKWLWPATGIWLYYLFLRFSYLASKTEGYFTYLLDDSYIHLGIAKNLFERGVFGLTESFSAVSSSPLYTLILYILNLCFGINEYYPLFINVLGSVGVLWFCLLYLRQMNMHISIAIVAISVLFVFSSVELLVFTGMEHVWHIFFMLLLIAAVTKPNPSFWQIAGISILLCAIRYEGLFSVAAAMLWLLWQVRMPVKNLVVIAIAAWLPATIYGLVSIYHGGFFLPNSLMLKSTDIIYNGGFLSIIMLPINKVLKLLGETPLNLLAVLGGYLLFKNRTEIGKLGHLFIVFLTLLLHVIFGKYGWVWRYETYLIFTLGFFSFVQLANLPQRNILVNPFIKYIPLFLILFLRGGTVLHGQVTASQNIYAQMVQMGRFAKTYLGKETVAINDVGAVSFYSNVNPMDCAGLSDNQIMHLVLNGTMYNPTQFRKLTTERKVHYALVFPHIYWPMHDKNWVECGKFTTKYNLVCADSTVLFFALDSGYAPYLKSSLAQFKMKAPEHCKVEIYGVDYQ